MKMLDLFSGIGGFHKGFEQAGYTFDWVGFSEIDKYASAVYKHKFPKAEELGDITTIQPGRNLPDHIDIVCGGFPCQAFSVAGKRKGFDDTRGTLFFEIARILRHYRDSGDPIPCLVLENVKGLLSHDNGRTFAVIYRILSDLGYTIEFQLLNTRWWLPQNRERIYIVGYIGNRGGPQVFPIGENGEAVGSECGSRDAVSCIDASYYKGADGKRTMIKQIGKLNNGDAGRVFDPDGIACTLKALGGGWGAKTGLYQVGELKITAKKRSHDTPPEINEYLKANKNGKTIGEIAKSTKLPKTQVEHYFRSDKYRAIPNPKDWMTLKTILQFDNTYDKQVTEIYEKEVEFESSRRVYSTDGISKTLDTHDSGYYQIPEATKKGNVRVHTTQPRSGNPSKGGHGPLSRDDGNTYCLDTGNSQAVEVRAMTEVRTNEAKELRRKYGKDPRRLKKLKERCDGVTSALTTGQSKESMVKLDTSIRRLTPVECNRLQGFSDNHNKYGVMDGKVVEMSDTQRYKQAGNAVTVNVVQAVAERIRPLLEEKKEV
ncbi:DNA (cytosine-5-)-methyltransferase [uncultured Mediterranean phage]|nr:DNA (cytosine-5-)-methyltransferase [uncultured Mediterranean phage]